MNQKIEAVARGLAVHHRIIPGTSKHWLPRLFRALRRKREIQPLNLRQPLPEPTPKHKSPTPYERLKEKVRGVGEVKAVEFARTTKTRSRKHQVRAELCAEYGVPNTGRQWRKARKDAARRTEAEGQ